MLPPKTKNWNLNKSVSLLFILGNPSVYFHVQVIDKVHKFKIKVIINHFFVHTYAVLFIYSHSESCKNHKWLFRGRDQSVPALLRHVRSGGHGESPLGWHQNHLFHELEWCNLQKSKDETLQHTKTLNSLLNLRMTHRQQQQHMLHSEQNKILNKCKNSKGRHIMFGIDDVKIILSYRKQMTIWVWLDCL